MVVLHENDRAAFTKFHRVFVYVASKTKNPQAANETGAAPVAIVNVEDEEWWR